MDISISEVARLTKSPEVLSSIAGTGSEYLMGRVLENEWCDEELLRVLSESEYPSVQLRAILHPNVPIDVLERFSFPQPLGENDEILLRTAVAMNPVTPDHIFEEIQDQTPEPSSPFKKKTDCGESFLIFQKS